MTDPADRLRLLARQHVETVRLLGVDFVPVAAAPAVLAATTPPPPRPAGAPPALATTTASKQSPPAPPAAEATLFGGSGGQGELHLGEGGGGPPELPPDQKASALEALRNRHDAECPHCTTADAHTQTVFGEGDAGAQLMFIGEAPGEQEDRTGRPFVGRAGRKLDEMITAMGMQRQDVYIANILKSRPPNNRAPLPSEVVACSPYLAEQIRVIRPLVIVGLGGPAVKWLLRTTEGITRLRGTWGVYVDGALRFPVMPTFHPAYLLRNYTLETRGRVWSDMQAVMAKLRREEG
ncbi:MAG: uracil-DNA glycosylase [Planctomycetota bacterium]|jgi:DNA polymerase